MISMPLFLSYGLSTKVLCNLTMEFWRIVNWVYYRFSYTNIFFVLVTDCGRYPMYLLHPSMKNLGV